MRRVVIGGAGSGCGKTTVVCAVLAALKKRNVRAAAFKCGPDYIDPSFHREAIGVPSHNLDGFFCDRDALLNVLGEYGEGSDIAVIEGVMGFYDGGAGSADSVSELTGTPAVVVLDCKGMSDSIGAVASGFLNYRPNNIAGFIFNRLPEKLVPLAEKICGELGTGYFGFLPKNDVSLESRRLGLVLANETEDVGEKLARLGELAEKYIRIDALLALEDAPLPEYEHLEVPRFGASPTIAVARDEAFCFLYEENIDLLEKMGCKIKYFSPLRDERLPESDGLILCGGYPELRVEELSANVLMRAAIREAIASGKPTIAECGGFMYLHDRIIAENGEACPMVGAISGEAFPTERLQRFGYISMTAGDDSLVCARGRSLRAHEFHYYDSTSCGGGFTARKTSGAEWKCCHTGESLYAGFPHLYFYSDIGAVERFVRKCIEYGEKHGQDK